MEGTCETCHQPECEKSTGGIRPEPGAIPEHVPEGRAYYRGYGEWVFHPRDAIWLLHRGWQVVNGKRELVRFIHNETFCTQIRVEGSDPNSRPHDGFVDAALTR